MPIVSSTFEFTTQANGSKNVVENHYDQDGTPYLYQWNAPAEIDIQTVVNNRAIELSEQLAQAEFAQIVGLNG